MVEIKTVKGDLYCDNEDGEEYEKWKLYGKVEWNGVESDVMAYLEDVLAGFQGHTVEITIKSVDAPKGPK